MSSLQKFHRRTNGAISNTLHTGTVSISGTAMVSQILTATNNIADADGLGTFAYQWKRSGSAISGATSSTYTLVSADLANTITVTITYTDSKGFTETETSAATASVVPASPFTSIGSGSNTIGYWLGTAGDGTSKLITAPKSTESSAVAWGSNGTTRNIVDNNNGLANTNALYAFGAAAHPAAAYCKTLTTGGYNTWYLPAKNELITVYSNQKAEPYKTNAQTMSGNYFWSSTETSAVKAWTIFFRADFSYVVGDFGGYGAKQIAAVSTRAVRRA